ncbi:MAG: GNAT family N-acetyltransferase [Planctomycetes bacterium]|nr:GNAT family N-acetyltransferase [Planctomycetota bacterium]
MIRFRNWLPADLPAAVFYWNRAFADRRNFFPIDERDFRDRVVANRHGEEAFDPAGFQIATDGAEWVGFAHAGRRANRGYLAFLHVREPHRRHGVGGALFDLCLSYLAGTDEVFVDGQCFNPYYGNVQGPFIPFWGTPEGISVPQGDREALAFLERRGFVPRFEAVTMERAPADSPVLGEKGEGNATFRSYVNACPALGSRPDDLVPHARFDRHIAWAAVVGERVAGRVIAYSMERARSGLWGIYDLEVEEVARGSGLGMALVRRALDSLAALRVETCEVLTIPALSPAAYRVYERLGFGVAVRWAIF